MKDIMAKLMVLIMDQYEQYKYKKRKSVAKALTLTQQTPAIPLPATNWSKYDTPTVLRNKGATRAFFL